MSPTLFPPAVTILLWDVDPERVDLERDRWFIMERVMSRGSWEAMRWLRSRYEVEALADFVRTQGPNRLTPRDLAYWALVCGVELEPKPGGGRPSWARPRPVG